MEDCKAKILEINTLLRVSGKPFLGGDQPSSEDLDAIKELLGNDSLHTLRWFFQMASFTPGELIAFSRAKEAAPTKVLGAAKPKEEAAAAAEEPAETDGAPPVPAVEGSGAHTVEVLVASANVKKIDPDAYGITERDGWVKLEIPGNSSSRTVSTAASKGKFDPIWDQTCALKLDDPSKQKIRATFYMGKIQLGDPQEFLLSSLIKGKWIAKGMAVPGGSVQFQLRAMDFGAEAKEEEEDDTCFDMMS